MEPKYITFEQAKWLKSKEFDEECRMCMAEDDKRPLPFNAGNSLHKNSIHPYYSAPEQHQLVDWLLDNHDIWVEVRYHEGFKVFYYEILNIKNGKGTTSKSVTHFNLPKEAYSAAFDYIKNNNLI
jgi:hypothetical protein